GLVLPAGPACAGGMEVFARGSVSKNYLSQTSYVVSISAATGVAFTLIPRIRLEARYTNASSLQNVLSIASFNGALYDVMTQTSIYSLGVDFDLMGPRSAFQPFIYVGAGYVRNERSFYALPEGASTSIYI